MLLRQFLPLLLAFSGVYATSESDFMAIPLRIDSTGIIQPQSATVVVQDSASWLVSEFTGAIGCSDIWFDSLAPGVGGNLDVMRVVWHFPLVKVDSARATGCAKVKRFRRVDRLPSLVFANSQGSAGGSIPYIPDSVKFCHDGNCRNVASQKVRTPSANPDQCLVGVLPPFATHAKAVAFLKDKVASSRKALVLHRQIIYYLQDATARQAELQSDTVSVIAHPIDCVISPELTIRAYNGPNYLGALSGWGDPRVGSSYALPSPGNANDLYGVESLTFNVDTVLLDSDTLGRFLKPGHFVLWSYTTGVKGYLYRGGTLQYNTCSAIPLRNPIIFADTLATSGEDLLVTNAKPQCGRKDVDALAGTHSVWFALLPTTGEPLESVFRHYSSVETDWSWPLEGDSIVLRGQKVSISELQSTAGVVRPSSNSVEFKATLVGRTLSVELAGAGELRVMDASGRVLVRESLASGRSAVALPQGARGLLVMQVGSQHRTIVAP